MREIVRDIAPLLGVLLPAIAAFFMYRRTEKDKAKEILDAANPNLQVIGRAIASEVGARLYVKEIQKLGQTSDRLAEGVHEVARSIREASQAQTQRENVRLAKAVEELTQQVKGRS